MSLVSRKIVSWVSSYSKIMCWMLFSSKASRFFLYIQMQFQYNIGLSVMFSSNFHAKSSCSIVYNFRSSNAVKLSYNNTMILGYYSLLPEIICNILYLFRYPFKIFFFYSSSFPLFFIFIVYSTNSKILKRKTVFLRPLVS